LIDDPPAYDRRDNLRLIEMPKFASFLAMLTPALIPGATRAADWSPPGPVKLLIAFAAGEGVDTQARLIARRIEDRLGWTIEPEQSTGRGGTLAAMAVAKAPLDGATIAMIVTGALTYNAMSSGMTELGLENYTPTAATARVQMGLVARAGSGLETWHNVTAAARARPLTVGAVTDRMADVIWQLSRTKKLAFRVAQTKGGAVSLKRLPDGSTELAKVAGPQAKGVADGTLVNVLAGLAVPLAMSPDARTLAQAGSGFDLDGYFLFIDAAGMPPEVRAAFAAAIEDAVTDPASPATALLKAQFGSRLC
jgi:tripartite-type tricarboxylate transporter receptor subunit TctC